MFDPLSLPINSGGLRPSNGHLGNWMTNQRIQWISATRFFHTWHRHLVSSGPGFRGPPISAAHLHSSASCDGSCMGGDDVRVRHQDFQVVFVAKKQCGNRHRALLPAKPHCFSIYAHITYLHICSGIDYKSYDFIVCRQTNARV